MIVFGERIAVGQEDYALVAEKFFVNSVVLISSDPENDTVARFDVFLQVIERGSFLDAGWAPRRPEIQHHNPSLQIGEMPRLPSDVQREVLRSLPRDRGLALAVARHSKKQQNR